MSNEALRIYSERNSVTVLEDVEQMYAPPESPLTQEQKETVYQFTADLYDGRYGEIKRPSAENLEEIAGMAANSFIQSFYLGYFHTPEGKADLVKMGLDPATPDVQSELLQTGKISEKVEPKERKEIAKRSLDWYKDLLTEALAADRSLDDAHLDQEAFSVNFQPQKLLNKIKLLQEHRRFYRQVRTQLKSEASGESEPVWRAKNLMLDQAVSRANNMLADLYTETFKLAKQLQQSPDSPENRQYMSQLEELMPGVHRAVTRVRNEKLQSLDEFQEGVARRTDHLLQGVDWQDEGISPISRELIDFAIEVESEPTGENARPGLFNKPALEKLKKTKWSAEQFKEFCEAILSEWNILSAEQADWLEAEERDGPAPDNKWQIVINPKSDSIAINRNKKLFKVPASFDRNLVKSLSVAAHELTHLAQAQSDADMSKKFPLAKAGGRRITGLREGGAVDQEAKVYAALGEVRPTRLGYLHALKAKLNGASRIAVARAFYDHYEDESKISEEERTENREIAADRALRLYRNAGYNSQPLDYIEGELFKRVLDAKKRGLGEAVLISAASFNLRDMAQLHQLGLYDPPVSTDWHPAEDVLRVYSEKYSED